MTDRFAIAEALDEIAARLGTTGDNPFRARAYAKGAEAVRALDDATFAERLAAGALHQTPGIGGALAAAITDLARTGRSDLLEKLRTSTPSPELLRVLTPKQAGEVARAGIGTLDALREALANGTLAGVRGFGPTTIQRTKEALAHAEARARRALLVDARPDAEALADWTGGTVAGDVRRGKETVDTLRVVVAGGAPEANRAASWQRLLDARVEPGRV
ncbi:MAG: DNA polymerase/3'-5' exonuclease PolX, partial [Myxococcota bacterium]